MGEKRAEVEEKTCSMLFLIWIERIDRLGKKK